jgi:thiamine biosynthesis lipoprotein
MSRLLRFRHEAMATMFEIIIPEVDADETYASQASQAVFDEIDRLEDELSRFRATSDIWRINNLKAGQSTNIGLAANDCLSLAKAVHAESNGAFDITVGPLMNAFRNKDGTPRQPPAEEESWVRSRVGMHLFDLDSDTGSVTSHCDFLLLDLGAVGKGYALDQAASLLADWSVPNVLLNAGDSTLMGLGAPPGETGWIVTVGNEEKQALLLNNRAVSGSGFEVKGNHIMNPRTMKPVPVKKERVWASAPTAALSDALSTAFMVMDKKEIEDFYARHEEVTAVLL